MGHKYPPLTPDQVRDMLKARGFTIARVEGSHEHWEHVGIGGQRRLVSVDLHYQTFDESRIKTMIAQSGLSREAFYGATKQGSKKLNLPWRKRA